MGNVLTRLRLDPLPVSATALSVGTGRVGFARGRGVATASEQQAAVFFSDFRSGVGTGSTAYTDGGKWPIVGGQGHEIVANDGSLGFPLEIPGLLKVNCVAAIDGFHFLRTAALGIPTRPFNRYYRWYFRLVKPLDTDGSQHPVQDGNSFSDSNWSMNVNQGPEFGGSDLLDDQWRVSSKGGNVQGPNGYSFHHQNTPVIFERHQTLRFEYWIENLSATNWRLHIRVFDASGFQVLSDSDFFNDSTNEFLSDNPLLVYAEANTSPGAFACGNNGWNDQAVDQVHSYQSGFGVSDVDWCGPYGNLEGEN